MSIEKKNYLDFEGLAQYDELIKLYIKNQANETSTTALEAIEELSQKVDDQFGILNGDVDVEGSIKQQITDAIAGVVDGAPETLDTLKEIASWIDADETGTAALINRVAANEDAIEALQKQEVDLKEYVDVQDKAYYDSIQSIDNLSIQSLFPTVQGEDESAAEAIAAIVNGGALKLNANQVVAEDVAIDKSCYIDANGSTFTGNVSVPATGDVTIANATFAKPVNMA